MSTFSEMAEKWIRENMPTPEMPQAATVRITGTPDHDPTEDRLTPLFVRWFDCRIHLDARGIALRQTPTWSTPVHALHADFVRWTLERDLAPPISGQFRHLLEELCFEVRDVGGEQLVPNVAFKEDIQAHEQFARSDL